MPLVTLTCRSLWYPPDDKRLSDRLTPRQQMVVSLANGLPGVIIKLSAQLHLEPDTPEYAVQVDIRKFHDFAVNPVDVWIHLWLTEAMSEDHQLDAREATAEELEKLFGGQELEWALDIFFGPGRGVISVNGEISQKW